MIITMAELLLPRIRDHFTDDRHHDDTSMTSDSSAMTRRRMALGPADSSSERASSKLLSVLYGAILCFQIHCVTRLKE